MAELRCDNCSGIIEGESVQRGARIYCAEACAFEAGRSKDCGGRTGSVSAPPVIELPPQAG